MDTYGHSHVVQTRCCFKLYVWLIVSVNTLTSHSHFPQFFITTMHLYVVNIIFVPLQYVLVALTYIYLVLQLRH